jgi:hypothetical protein
MNSPILWQRIEGAVIFCAALYFYGVSGSNLLWFFVFLFAFDISMAGYFINTKMGAFMYNLGHSYFLPGILLIGSYTLTGDLELAIALIWIAHIGLDRAFGYGLKEITSFHDTHLGKIGKK